MIREIDYKNDNFIIRMPYDPDYIAKIKNNLIGRRWDSAARVWIAPVCSRNIRYIINHLLPEYELTIRAKEIIDRYSTNKIETNRNRLYKLSKAIESNFSCTIKNLYPYQKAGVEYIELAGGRALVADPMGLGKTVIALAWCDLHKPFPVLIICPASVKLNWEQEIYKWIDNATVQVIYSDSILYQGYNYYIINYDILDKKKNELLTKIKPKTLILDEIHYIKNSKTKRAKAVKAFAKIPHIIGLSGTPFLNRPVELYNPVQIIKPNLLGSFWSFVQQYTNVRLTRYGWDFSGSKNEEELALKLRSTCLIRREKQQVLQQLPEKTRVIISVSIKMDEYMEIENNLIRWLKENKGMSKERLKRISRVEELAKIEYLKQKVVDEKYASFLSWCKEFLDTTEEKLVIFAYHTEYIKRLEKDLALYSALAIYGDINADTRHERINKFQTEIKYRVIICSAKISVGFNLTASSYVAFLELGWTPGEHEQAEDRCHRITSRNNVSCYYFIAKNTIEEKIYFLIQNKRRTFSKVMQDKTKIEEKANILDDLINDLIKKGGMEDV